MQVERTKLSRKFLYHFEIFAIVNELLIVKNRRKPSLPQARNQMQPSSRLLGARGIVYYKRQ